MRVSLEEMVQLRDTLFVHCTGGLTGDVVNDGCQLLVEIGLLRRVPVSMAIGGGHRVTISSTRFRGVPGGDGTLR